MHETARLWTRWIAVAGAALILASAARGAASPRNPFEPAYNAAALQPVSSVAVPFKIVAILRPSVSASPIEPRMPAQSDFGRVSGIILSGGAHAIYVTTSGATVLQPGDRLPDAAGSKVQSIDADGITVSTTDGRLVRLALSD